MRTSVIIIARNSETSIEGCVNSVLAQWGSLKEVIVIDDGSDDATMNLVRSLSKNDSRVRLMSNGKLGRPLARNLGAMEAFGDVVAFIDSDCIAKSGWLENLIDPLKYGTHASFGRIIHRGKDESVVSSFLEIDALHRMENLTLLPFLHAGNSAFRKDFFLSMGGFDEGFARLHDIELSGRIHDIGERINYSEQAVVEHRGLSTSLTGMAKKEFFKGLYFVKLFLRQRRLKGYAHVRPWFYVQPLLAATFLSLPLTVFPFVIATSLIFVLNRGFLSRIYRKNHHMLPLSVGLILLRNLIWLAGGLSFFPYILMKKLRPEGSLPDGEISEIKTPGSRLQRNYMARR